VNTLGPALSVVQDILIQVMDVLEVIGEIVPIVGSVLGVIQSVVGAIAELVTMIFRIMNLSAIKKAKNEGSDDIKHVGQYAYRKVFRSVFAKAYTLARNIVKAVRGITNVAADIASFFTLGIAQIIKAVTLGVGILDNVVASVVQNTRRIKGLVKMIKGTRKVNRRQNAEILVDKAISGDMSAKELILGLDAYGLSARISRSQNEGIFTLLESAKEGMMNQFGLGPEASKKVAQSFFDWGKNKLDEFVKLCQGYKIRNIGELIKFLFYFLSGGTKEQKMAALDADIATYKKTKTQWREQLVIFLMGKLASY
jgi:hypothetical protein